MGSVVTRSIAPHALVVGTPARQIGWVCRCGHPVARAGELHTGAIRCSQCGKSYTKDGTQLVPCGA
jgi:UDP-2-acetamido-3-amino-2,3-dideoxy-glucuronate N-acetyltransferase